MIAGAEPFLYLWRSIFINKLLLYHETNQMDAGSSCNGL